MVIRKIIGLLFAVLLAQIGAAQENPYDNAIGEAISPEATGSKREPVMNRVPTA